MTEQQSRSIPFEVEIGRIVELLANQIYQSPLALLRENAQNGFDAVLLRVAHEPSFSHGLIEVEIATDRIAVTDNGIGMSSADLENNFWKAGSSGKNNAEARAAGVVGTFGIGAMANFGIATHISVETESLLSGERTRSAVSKENLSTTEDCIELTSLQATGSPGTTVTALMDPSQPVNVIQASKYIGEFVQFAPIDVVVNGVLASQKSVRSTLPSEQAAWSVELPSTNLGGVATADIEIRGMASGEVRVVLDSLNSIPPQVRAGQGVLVEGKNAIQTLRSGFGLATITVPSHFQFGGVIDFAALQPTAGREALEVGSNQLLQRMFAALDDVVAVQAAAHEEAFQSQHLLRWIAARRRFDLCGPLTIRIEPGSLHRRLDSIEPGSSSIAGFYTGADSTTILSFSSDESPVAVAAQRGPRRDCEIGYLRRLEVAEIDDRPKVLSIATRHSVSMATGAVALRIVRILADDYLLEADVLFGKLSHGFPILVQEKEPRPEIVLDPDSAGVATLAGLYDTEYAAFAPFVKDFVRAQVFPKVKHLVPTTTREGAEAFLRRLRSRRELFEIEFEDREDLEEIWARFDDGEISLTEAATQSASAPRRSVVVVRPEQSMALETVLVASEVDSTPVDPFAASPPIDRRGTETEARILTSEGLFNGYSSFLSLTDTAFRQNSEFFQQPHTTSIVWGGQKALFVFQHHSGRFGLYYDVLLGNLVGVESGGGPFRTSTLLFDNRVFIPLPAEIQAHFLPAEGERRRLEVRSDVLHLGDPDL